jgi:hypothetical protein
MDDRPDSLQVLFRKAVPVEFVSYLQRRQEWIYQEAYQSCYGDPRWTEAEARSLLGDTERALFESEMRRAAEKFGLTWRNADHVGLNCTYVKVIAGPFRISAHRVPSPGSFVRPCESRKQDAAVNKFMDGYVLDGALSVPLPRLERASEIAIHALHGSIEVDSKKNLFLELAAPDSELETYRWQCSFMELRQAYLSDARSTQSAKEIEDRAKPTPRKKKRKQQGEKE